MDMGIRGRHAIVCAASKGLGKACALSLAREGVDITMIARTKDVLEAAAKEIRDATGVRVTAVAGDVTTETGRAAVLAACPEPDILGLSNGARTGLTGFVAGLARKTVGHNVTINNLLPGPFDTDRLRSTIAIQAKTSGRTIEEVVRDRHRANPSGRFGDPAEFGDLCAFVCSAQAGFMTGQNFLIDGGGYPGTL